MKILTSNPAGHNTAVAIALPDTDGHREIIDEIYSALTKLDIIVFWVSKDSIKRQ